MRSQAGWEDAHVQLGVRARRCCSQSSRTLVERSTPVSHRPAESHPCPGRIGFEQEGALLISAAERRGVNLNGFMDFHMRPIARIWPRPEPKALNSWLNTTRSSGPVHPSLRALSGRLELTIRRRKFNKGSVILFLLRSTSAAHRPEN